MRDTELTLRPLLDHLAAQPSTTEGDWRGWTLAPVDGGQNNRLYRATGHGCDLAVKFTIRDDRHRAEREHSALSALAAYGLDLAPQPVLLDTAYSQPVVAQQWLPGRRLTAPPPDDAMWRSLLAYLAILHAVTPDRSPVPLREAVLTARTSGEARDLVRREVARVPEAYRPDTLRALLSRFQTFRLPEWPPAAVGLCRVDANTANFLWDGEAWRSVDWENSGWGDPAFEIADLTTHPAYLDVPAARWSRVVESYAGSAGDPGMAVRINAYRKAMLVWWVARFNRYLYDAPRGRDRRLIARPSGWEEEIKAKYRRYLGRAVRTMSGE